LALCVDQMGNSRPMTDPYAGFARKYG
jgi:hypothetical protein